MLLRYIGEDEILKEMLGDKPRQVSVCTLNDRFLLNVDVGCLPLRKDLRRKR